MLYSREELSNPSFDHHKAMARYVYKFINQKSEFKRLKEHEKEYAFNWMRCMCDDSGNPAFDLYVEPLAFEYLFYNIILTYGEDVDSFDGSFEGAKGELSQQQVQKDKHFFFEYLDRWKNEIENRKGQYLSIITPMLKQKLAKIKSICSSDEEYRSRETYCYAVFFYIYYKSKLLFDEMSPKAVLFEINGYKFAETIYSFCHIFTRHYVPSLNRGLENSMNDNLPFININNFLQSLKELVQTYFSFEGIIVEPSTEYLLFQFNGHHYILWIKYKSLDVLNKQKGFELRSFYKCQSEQDLNKFKEATAIEVVEGFDCMYKM